MLILSSILKDTLNNLKAKSVNFEIIDDEHLLNKHTGAMMHLYDDDFKVSYNGDVIIEQAKFRPEELDLIWEIKKAMTTQEEFDKKRAEYPKSVEMARRAFSDLYEFPKPLADKMPKLSVPDLERDAKTYTGIQKA